MSQTCCFHCGETVTKDGEFQTQVNGKIEEFCCAGCEAVCNAILEAGLNNYYKFRTDKGARQDGLVPEQLQKFQAFDIEDVQQEFVANEDDVASASITIDGITCAACAWLIEQKVRQLDGLVSISVNSTTERALLRWDPSKLALSQIFTVIHQIGYQASPFVVNDAEITNKQNSRRFLLRLGLAGLATMQVMMFALALYSEAFFDVEPEYVEYFRWVSMIFAAPVVLYSAQPFYFSAFRALWSGRVNMDTPVSIAIIVAYISSCIATVNGTGEVYFESVSMFTFFLLIGRYFEQKARQKAAESASNLHKLVPLSAQKITADGVETVSAKSLQIGDAVLVADGDAIPVDGVLIEGSTSVNESMLTGEHLPVEKQLDDTLYAGTINVEQPITLQVSATGQAQLVSQIIRLQDEAASAKPAVAMLADKLARYFIPGVLISAALSYLIWSYIEPSHAFWVALAVLVATCPCALSLATPTAVTSGTARLQMAGILSRRKDVFERLTQIDGVIFDKTGTLTHGNFHIKKVELLGDASEKQALAIAAAMEQGSTHPIAKAFAEHADSQVVITSIESHVGHGVSAEYQGDNYRLGSHKFTDQTARDSGQHIWLLKNQQPLARFELSDQLRHDAKACIEELKAKGMDVVIASGDAKASVAAMAERLNVDNFHAEQSPQNKLELIQSLQASGKRYAMFGDGINDAPVLAGADLSLAMGSGAAVSKSKADLILLGDKLQGLSEAVSIAKQTQTTVKQNLMWALGYNITVLPLAMAGLVPPYLAALGMSASSLLVVGNSVRLLKKSSTRR
ncbi:heavy metal translocating P-type ATPase [Paraferrimonas sedimenticola]|uniref:Copper-translocating P-type ATPase n=1 Tax=Paraferrimonas sedimenticola TaxID=375674 RepID=A0AA37RW66_9GAMM|nr:heavy metal translocating P-type ATPase metal-binding domain-containing protein [Paraferrimonas sedimenticola]GLP96089.1 copper-translocating P-type ATPase [Paraferrimonas sedimenticola]